MRARVLLLVLGVALSGCGAHVEAMKVNGPPVGVNAPELKDAIAVGKVSGGSSLLNNAGVTDDEFKTVLTYALQSSGVLAPSLARAHWRLDATLDFDPKKQGLFSDQQIDFTTIYDLYTQPGGERVFERTIATTDTRKAPEAGVFVLEFLLAGVNGVGADADARRRAAYESTVRQSLGQFLAQLSDWQRGDGTAVAAAREALPTASTPVPPQLAPSAAPSLVQAPVAPTPLPPQKPREVVTFGDGVPFRCPAPRTEITFLSGADRVFAEADGIGCPYAAPGQRGGYGDHHLWRL